MPKTTRKPASAEPARAAAEPMAKPIEPVADDAQTVRRLAQKALELEAPRRWTAAFRLAAHLEAGALPVAMRAHRQLLKLELAWEKESGNPDADATALIRALYDFISHEGRFYAYSQGEWCRSADEVAALSAAMALVEEEAAHA